MKHLNLFIAIYATTALLASCAKEMQEETKRVSSVDWESIVIKGTQEGGGITKTSVDGTTGKVYWSPGDEITVFLGTAGTKYVGQNTEKAATTTFVCSSSVVIGSTEGSGDNLYGLYPFDANAGCDGSTITTTLPETQKAKEGTFRDSLFITVGKATVSNPTMGFYNVCGGVRFTVTTEGITSVTFKGNNDEILAGKVKLAIGNDNIPTVSEVVEGKKEVTLTCAEGFKTGTMYYITTLPVTLTKGYTMTFSTADKTGILTVNNATEIKRSVFGTLENADENAVWDGFVYIPDANFKAYCVANFDKDGDREISYSEAETITHIEVYTNDIESLEGIESFVNLKYLSCNLDFDSWMGWGFNGDRDILIRLDNYEEVSGKLTRLDVSKNASLTYLSCVGNQLTSLNLSNNRALTTLDCHLNQLSSLDLTNNLSLQSIDCWCNKLTSLRLDNNTALTRLDCDINRLTSLDVSNNASLSILGFSGNQLTSLDISYNTVLTELSCDNNQLVNLDLHNNQSLKSVRCSNNQFVSLDISENSVLKELWCHNSPKLKEIWLKTGQTITDFKYDTAVATLKYKVDDGGGEPATFENW